MESLTEDVRRETLEDLLGSPGPACSSILRARSTFIAVT